jgi:hypothetical protein
MPTLEPDRMTFWKLPLCVVLVLGCAAVLLRAPSTVEAQGVLSFSGQIRSAYPQSTMIETIATVSATCSSISNLSRRCFFTFDKSCKARGESKDHCTRMSGFCHGCTDAYATCKGRAAAAKTSTGAASTNCTQCNVAYGRCIQRMVQQYGGSLVRAR